MKLGSDSITRRLILSVLVLELLAGVTLIAVVAANERRVQYNAFDANLRATSNAMLGAVQEGLSDQVRLDLGHETLPAQSLLRVTDEHGMILGSEGEIPVLTLQPNTFQHAKVNNRSYRFFTLTGEKIFDPDEAGGIHHQVTIVYGLPDGHVAHQVFESIRFFVICTIFLLGITTVLLVWLIRRLLSPIHALASAASQISSNDLHFDPPLSASRFVELRPLTSAIEKTIERLQRAFGQQKRFTSDAAHELKTDLAIIKSSLQLLSMRTRTVTEYRRGLEIALDDLTRLENTVQKMLTLARLEQPQPSANKICRIDEVLLLAVQQSTPLARLGSNEIVVSMASAASVALDREDAILLCSNLLINALQHSPEDATVEVVCSHEGEQVRLSVRDHGDGINEDDAPLLFGPFYRGDPSRSRNSGGTGLGLSICKAICDRARGSIAIGNHVDGGAIVIVNLPDLEA